MCDGHLHVFIPQICEILFGVFIFEKHGTELVEPGYWLFDQYIYQHSCVSI